jgi:hypothetical protein
MQVTADLIECQKLRQPVLLRGLNFAVVFA